MPKNLHYLLFNCLKYHNFYIGSTIRLLRIKEHLKSNASLLYKHLIKYKNNDNNFSIKIEAIVHNVGNLRIKEALNGLVDRVYITGPGDRGSIPGRVISKTLKMVHDTSLLNTQHCKVRIKGKVEQPRERRSALLYTSV